MAVSLIFELGELGADLFVGNDVFGTVNWARNSPRLVPQRVVVVIQRTELRVAIVDNFDDGLCQPG